MEGGEYADVVFDVHGKKFSAHKCILAARSDYFLEMFMERWKGRNEISITHELVNPFAFQAILQYLYTGTTDFRNSWTRSGWLGIATFLHKVRGLSSKHVRQLRFSNKVMTFQPVWKSMSNSSTI